MMDPQIYNSKEGKLFTFLIAFMAFGNVYQLPGVAQLGLGEILLIAFIPAYFRRDLNISFGKKSIGFIVFFAYLTTISLVMLNYFGAPLSKLISIARVAFYWTLIFYFGENLFDLKFFKKCAYVFAVTLSLFIIAQFFVFAIMGFYIPGFIPGVPLNQGGMEGMELIQRSLDTATILGFIRPSGFLLEPAHCVQYLCVCLLLFMNDEKLEMKKQVGLIFLITFAMIIVQSTTGLVVLVFSWFIFMFVGKKMFWMKFLIFSLFIFLLLSGAEIDNWALKRIVNVVTGSEIDHSSNVRLNNGLNLFVKFPLAFKMFGSGMGMFDYISFELGFGKSLNYMNSFSFILFSAGFVGMGIWLFSLMMLFISSNCLGMCLTVGFFILTTGCSIFCQPVMVWMFLIILTSARKMNDRYSSFKLQ